MIPVDDLEIALRNQPVMLSRGLYEIDGVAALEIKKATGTVRLDGQTCTLANYRASINYWLPGMRAQYACTTPDGRMHKAIEVVNGQVAWDEDISDFGYRDPRGGRALLELAPVPSWHELQFRR